MKKIRWEEAKFTERENKMVRAMIRLSLFTPIGLIRGKRSNEDSDADRELVLSVAVKELNDVFKDDVKFWIEDVSTEAPPPPQDKSG